MEKLKTPLNILNAFRNNELLGDDLNYNTAEIKLSLIGTIMQSIKVYFLH
jgi:hypothetical protein